MKLLASITLLFAVICSLVAIVSAETQGTASMMNFEGGLTKRGRGTWYSGNDLKNAACYDRNGLPAYSATIHSMIGAMAMRKFENCYKCMKITNLNNRKLNVIVKIVDLCAGCHVGTAIDLTPAAFQKLAPKGNLGLGVLNIGWTQVRCPQSKLYPSKPKA
ncbi:hypothetical protein DM01DRAFT_1384515 [Hesseltinella vesiculosa]|uniref:Barwin domain-containing protein n=1 Tax=Hesseltinella vesiculosa TaxID=101127 RepID=A0A1X2GDG6_9FUNG|nr:hypothetical protein DM01DRAFT_1384515 [Hesseltinella vesiculosa]